MKTNEERLKDLMDYIGGLSRIHPSDIPDIDLYMDQVTTFMDTRLCSSRRLGEERVLTKTMINNYAKNNLLPPPEKKKYSKNHILLLTFIYYFKNVLSFKDIEQILAPIADRHFKSGSSPELSELYEEVFSLESEQRARLTEDVQAKFESAMKTFSHRPAPAQDSIKDVPATEKNGAADHGDTAPTGHSAADERTDGDPDRIPDGETACADQEYLRLFSFICELAFDVYLKKQMLELIAEQLRQETPAEGRKKKEHK